MDLQVVGHSALPCQGFGPTFRWKSACLGFYLRLNGCFDFLDGDGHCLRGGRLENLLMFSFWPASFPQVYFRRNYPDITFTSPVAVNTSNGQPSALTIFETALWLPGRHKVCFEGVPCPAKGLVLCSLQHAWFFVLLQILHRQETSVFGFFPSDLILWFQVLTKWPVVLF